MKIPSTPPKKLLERFRDAIITPTVQNKPMFSGFAASSFATPRMGVPEIAAFLTHLAITENVAASTQK